MNRDFQVRFTASLLALLTAAAMVYAVYNFQVERAYQVPYDGAWWVEHSRKLIADRVPADGPGARAGSKVGDELTAVNKHAVNSTAALTHQV